MNVIKLKVYRFQHPFVCSTYINTFDWKDMVDEGDQTIRQHRFANFTIFPSKMSTLFFCQQDLIKHLLRQFTTSFPSFLSHHQHCPSHFTRRKNFICNVITLAHTSTFLILIKFLGNYFKNRLIRSLSNF